MRIRVTVALMLAAIGSYAIPANAQDHFHSIDRSDVRHYADLLELDELQREAAIELHREYVAEMRRIGKALQERAVRHAAEGLEDIKEGRLATGYIRSMMRAMAAANEEPNVLTPISIEHKLLDDILALAITPEQRDCVERVERAWCRDRASAIPSPWGDSADVAAMVRETGLADIDGIDAILLEYEVEIDPVRRMFTHFDPEEIPAKAPLDGEEPFTLGESQLRAKRINTKYASRIKTALPVEAHDAWNRAVREAFWPEPYERSGPQKVLMTLLLAKNLSDEDRAELEGIQSRYQRRAKTINGTWALALDAHLHADAAQDWASAGEANETIYECREDRRQLDKEFEAILSEFRRNR